MTQLMWPSQGLQNSRRLDKYKWISASQGSMSGSGALALIEGVGNGDTIQYNSQIPNLIEDFVPTLDNFVLTDIPGSLEGLQFSKGTSDGKHFYSFDATNNVIKQYDMSLPYDLNTAFISGHGLNLINPGTELDFEFSGDGKLVYYLELEFGDFKLFSVMLNEFPWELRGSGGSGPGFNFGNSDVIRSISFSEDGLTLFALTLGVPSKIRQYTLTVPFDTSTMSYSGTETTLTGIDGVSIRLAPNGLNVYVGATNETVFRYELTLPNDLSTISTSADGMLNLTSGAPFDIFGGFDISNNVTRLYAIDNLDNTVHQWVSPDTEQGPIEVVQ